MSHFRECEWRPHTSLKVGLRQQVEEKVRLVLKMKYQRGDDFQLPLLNYVVKFHQKNNPVEYPILIYFESKFPLPLTNDSINQRGLQLFQYFQAWDLILVETLHQKFMQSELNLDSASCLFFSDLTLLVIGLLGCVFLTTISNLQDEAIPTLHQNASQFTLGFIKF